LGKWLEWTGKLWREDRTLRAFDLVRRSCKAQGIKRASMSKMLNAALLQTSLLGGLPV
jgi:hypothetical protein